MSENDHDFRWGHYSVSNPSFLAFLRSARERLSGFPRVRITHSPTEFEPLERLSKRLEGPTIWIKRDDCTGLAGGGNKARKLEFLLGAAIAADADTLITAGAIQSNHARQAAAAAAKFDMRCILVLTQSVAGRGRAYHDNGNLLLDRILGAEIHIVDGDVDSAAVMGAIANERAAQGKRPFVVPVGGSNAIGTLGYVDGFLELAYQFEAIGTDFHRIILPTGSGGTQAGILLGAAISGWPGTVHGVSVGSNVDRQHAKVKQLRDATARLMNVHEDNGADGPDIMVDDRHVGSGYGQPAPETIDAIRLVAEAEGLLLDPVYTGKAMAALISCIRLRKFPRGENVVFLHTGGNTALGGYPECFN